MATRGQKGGHSTRFRDLRGRRAAELPYPHLTQTLLDRLGSAEARQELERRPHGIVRNRAAVRGDVVAGEAPRGVP